MDKRLKQLWSRLVSYWKALDAKKKKIIVAVFAGSLVVIAAVVALSNTVHYSLLYTGLDSSEAGEVLEQVQALNVPVKVKGSSIYVDSRQADEVKMKLAEAGYPRSTLSYDIFMKGTSWAMTDSDKQKLALYQLQDRLQDTIKTIAGINSVQVTISGQNQDDYVLDNSSNDVTASVKLNLTPGVGLTSQQVKGIALLVARSVPDLKQSNVVVVDSDGTALYGGDTDTGSDDGTSADLALQKQVEQSVNDKIRTLLEPIFGNGNVRVASAVTMDFSTRTTDRTSYEPSGVSMPANSTASSQTGSAAVNTNQYAGGTAAIGISAASSAVSQASSSLVDTVNEQIEENGGRVEKLTVAVVIDSRSPAAAGQNTDTLRQTISYAAGIDAQNVSIQLTSFATSSQSEASSGGSVSVMNQRLLLEIGVGIGALALLLILLVVVLSVRARRRRAAEDLRALEAQETPPQPAVARANIEEILSHDMAVLDSKRRLEQYAEERPELVAQLLKGWLKE